MKWLALVLLLAVPCFADEEEAIAALRSAGVTFQNMKESDERFVIVNDSQGVVHSAERLKRLAELSWLKTVELILYSDKFDKKIPAVIGTLNVKRIVLTGSFRDEDMKELAKAPMLERIDIHAPNITDAGLLNLANCKTLRLVTVASDKVSQEACAKLNDKLPKCTVHKLH
jgi:hypothetical protein